jgi:hypothetical protein
MNRESAGTPDTLSLAPVDASLPAHARRQAVLVLGMHRSGTSALGGVLAGLGVQPPRTPVGATGHNPRGYFESAELVRFHDRLLKATGGSWRDWGRFDPHWARTPEGQAHVAEAAGIVAAEFGDASMLLVKDPRICRFVPFWLAVLGSMGIAPRIIMPVRHPLEVARSLGARNGFGLERSLLLWLRHVLDAEAATRALPRTVVTYDDLLGDWRGQSARMARDLGLSWPATIAQAEGEIDAYLAPELRHHEAAGPAVFDPSLRMGPLAGWVEDTWHALLALREPHPPSSARAVLDTIGQAFDLACVPFAEVSREQEARAERDVAASRVRTAERVRVLEVELERVRTALARQTEMLDLRLVEVERLAVEARRHHDQLLAREAELTRRHSELDALKRAATKAATETAQRVARLRARFGAGAAAAPSKAAPTTAAEPVASPAAAFDDVDRQLDALIKRQANAVRQRTLDQREIARQAAELARLQGELDAATGSLSWRLAAPLRRLEAWTQRRRAQRAAVADVRLIAQSEWFDAAWYLRQYPDVAAGPLEPCRHYLEFGAAEGRNPGPKFDTGFYLATYGREIAPGMNPLVHFLRHGRSAEFRPHPAT